ncbi:MAG: hypothetical protein ACTH1D_04625 [Mycobacteriaceae bacterium]|uniref:hypothetical protein n=1 Tax=Corynebacterium sp. TaxID=1720 RepID=UPI003F986AD3
MTTTSPHPTHIPRRTRPRARRSGIAALTLAAGLAVSAGTGTAAADSADLPPGTPQQVGDAIADSTEYAGYVAGSVEAFFQLPPAEAIGGSAAAGSIALCLLLPVPGDTCVI